MLALEGEEMHGYHGTKVRPKVKHKYRSDEQLKRALSSPVSVFVGV